MTFEKTNLEGLLLIKPDIFYDSRGFFYESFSKEKYFQAGINLDFVQDNISKSVKGTVRGMHYQIGKYAQGKLCTVVLGKVLDVTVDIRFGSPTYGKHFSCEISDENKHQIWVPPGFAHGFAVLSEVAIFSYKCTEVYSKEDERSILYNDPELNIDWKIENHIVSDKDLRAKKFCDIEKDFLFNLE